MGGDVETFNTTAYIRSLSSLLSVRPAAVTIDVQPASVRVITAIDVESASRADSVVDTLLKTLEDPTTAATALGLEYPLESFTRPSITTSVVHAPSPPPERFLPAMPPLPPGGEAAMTTTSTETLLYLPILFCLAGCVIGAIVVHVLYRRRCKPVKIRPMAEDLFMNDARGGKLTPRPQGEAYQVRPQRNDRSERLRVYMEKQRMRVLLARWLTSASRERQFHVILGHSHRSLPLRRYYRQWRRIAFDMHMSVQDAQKGYNLPDRADSKESSDASTLCIEAWAGRQAVEHTEPPNPPEEYNEFNRSGGFPKGSAILSPDTSQDPQERVLGVRTRFAPVLAMNTIAARHKQLQQQQQRTQNLPPLLLQRPTRTAPVLPGVEGANASHDMQREIAQQEHSAQRTPLRKPYHRVAPLLLVQHLSNSLPSSGHDAGVSDGY